MKKAESEPPLSVQVKDRNPEAQGRTGECFFHHTLEQGSRATEESPSLDIQSSLGQGLEQPKCIRTALSKGLDKEPPEVTSHLNYYSVLQF